MPKINSSLRRLRTTIQQIPTVDLIGPPDPLSNLRPIFYAPLFPSLHQSTSSPTGVHPYSLSEFPIPSTKQQLSSQKLEKYKLLLNSEDIEWRLTRYRVDAFNQQFWSKTNTAFLLARDSYILSNPNLIDSTAEIDLSPFYAQHLASTKYEYAVYNRQLWRLQAGLLWPALKAALRPWKFKYAAWKAGVTV